MLLVVECWATSGTIRFQVSDGTLTSTGDLTVNVTAHVVQTLTYENVSVSLGASTTNSPTIDGISLFNDYSVQSKGTYTGTISIDIMVSFQSVERLRGERTPSRSGRRTFAARRAMPALP